MKVAIMNSQAFSRRSALLTIAIAAAVTVAPVAEWSGALARADHSASTVQAADGTIPPPAVALPAGVIGWD